MIELIFQNNIAFVYKLADWETLREKYRIIGHFLGATQYVPTLPLRLLPEETQLLLDQGVVKLLQYDALTNAPQATGDEAEFERNLMEEIKLLSREVRQQQVEKYIDKIIAGKRKKGDTRSKEEIFDEEVNRKVEVNAENLLWPINLHSRNLSGNPIEITKEQHLEIVDENSYKIFKDLWNKDFFITTGEKFGVDFLLYEGDPLMYHAVYIVKCLDSEDEAMHPTELVVLGRMGTSVKKRAVLAVVAENTVKYITVNWLQSS